VLRSGIRKKLIRDPGSWGQKTLDPGSATLIIGVKIQISGGKHDTSFKSHDHYSIRRTTTLWRWALHSTPSASGARQVFIRDVYPGARIRLFSIPDTGSRILIFPSRIPDPHQRILRILTPKKCFFYDPDPDFLPIPDPGVKKALDPGSRSATLAELEFGIAHNTISIRCAPSFYPDVYPGSRIRLLSIPDLGS
jgi:hypothetical protein